MLIERVQKLFRGRPELVNGFLRFFDNTPAETTQTDVRERPSEERVLLLKIHLNLCFKKLRSFSVDSWVNLE